MKIAVVQMEPKLEKIDYNKEYILNKFLSIEADLIIFPELSTSGYYFQSKEELINFTEKNDSIFIKEIKKIADRTNKAIIFGFPELLDGDIFNSSALIIPNDSNNYIYRKTHLFYQERFCFSPGNTGFFNVYWEEKDINIGMMICYDWRFPESARTLALKGADLIVCPSNLVTDVWHISMPSRALENKVYLAVSNRYGDERRNDNTLKFTGQSAIWNFNGSLIIQAPKDEESIIFAEIFPEKTRNKSFNEYNDIFMDRRTEFYY